MTESYAGNYLTNDSALSVYNSDVAASTATIKVSGNSLTLTKDGTPTVLNLEDAANDTLTKLVSVINTLTSNWVAALLGVSSRASKDMVVDLSETNCLLEANLQTLKTLERIVTNWPQEWEAIQKRELIQEQEEKIELITKDYFYENSFVIERNGNGKNELDLGVTPDILSVSKIEIFNIEIDSTWYTHDKNSIYLDLAEIAGADLAELNYRLRWTGQTGIFSKGIRSIRVTGAYGKDECPREVRTLISIMIMDALDPTLYDHWIQGMQAIGSDARYENPQKIYTGIMIADQILRRRIKKKVILRTTT